MTKYSTRILLALATVALSLPSLTTLSAQSSPNTPQTIVGEVTDTMCAPSKSHLGMMAQMPNMGHDASSCAKECAKIGARYVLFDNQTGKVYQVDDHRSRRITVTSPVFRNVTLAAMVEDSARISTLPLNGSAGSCDRMVN